MISSFGSELQFWSVDGAPIFVEKRDISRKSARFPTTKRAMSETVPETEPTQEYPVQGFGGGASMSLPLNCLRNSGPTAMTGPSPVA